MSITKAKYIILGYAAQEVIWLRYFINKLQVDNLIYNIILYKDNKMNIMLTKNAKNLNCIKHIDVQHYYICKLVKDRDLEIKWICNSSIFTNRFTKALSIDTFYCYQSVIGLNS